VLTPSIKLVPLIKTNMQNMVKNDLIKVTFNKLSKKSILVKVTKFSNKNKYPKITTV
jgi:hypothetical protein|tara:strand:+ start:618 stop:788 length:171 start_codon:yes stop_codon:yes gene_type:complete